MTEPYFGMSKKDYLQTLANRWGDFGVSWNWYNNEGERMFTRKRSVIELSEEDYCRLDKVMHREAMPKEILIEIDDLGKPAIQKLRITRSVCNALGLEYATYKSRNGYHMSVLDMQNVIGKKLIALVDSDRQFFSKKVTWSLEWTNHWKQKDHVLYLVECTTNYERYFLGRR